MLRNLASIHKLLDLATHLNRAVKHINRGSSVMFTTRANISVLISVVTTPLVIDDLTSQDG